MDLQGSFGAENWRIEGGLFTEECRGKRQRKLERKRSRKPREKREVMLLGCEEKVGRKCSKKEYKSGCLSVSFLGQMLGY